MNVTTTTPDEKRDEYAHAVFEKPLRHAYLDQYLRPAMLLDSNNESLRIKLIISRSLSPEIISSGSKVDPLQILDNLVPTTEETIREYLKYFRNKIFLHSLRRCIKWQLT